jgi:CHAD domain-containing protein
LTANPIPIAGKRDERPKSGRRTSRNKLRLRRHVPLREAILGAFSGILLVARRCAATAAAEPAPSVHDFRKSLRRARSIIALLRPALGNTAVRGLTEELRSAFRKTNDIRDGDVLAATLAGLAGDDPELFVEAAEVAARLSAGPKAPDPESVLREAIPILRKLPAALEVTLPREYSTPELELGLARGYQRAQRAWVEASTSRTDTDFHEWRKRVKELRYQIELLASTGSPSLKARERPLGTLARELGEVTDQSLLCVQIEALDGAAGAGTGAGEGVGTPSRLLERARAVVRERSNALLAEGGPFFSDSPRIFARKVLAERG